MPRDVHPARDPHSNTDSSSVADGHSYSIARADTYACGDAHANSHLAAGRDSQTYAHTYVDPDSISYGDPHTHAYRNTNAGGRTPHHPC